MNAINLDLENYGLWYVPFWKTKLFYFAVIFFGLILLSIIIFLIYKKFKQDNSKESLSSILRELNQLEKDLPNKSSKEFYFKLIFLVKKYIFICYNIDISSKTDSELIEFLKNMDNPPIFNDEIKDIIYRSTSARFASRELAELQMRQDLKNMINLIESSKTLIGK